MTVNVERANGSVTGNLSLPNGNDLADAIEEIKLRTGKSLLEALIFASTNPQNDKRLFIDLLVLYMKTTSSEHVVYVNCSECENKNKK